MADRVDLRGLNYRVIERDIDGKTQWVAQHRTKYDAWEDCYDDRDKLVARDHASSARHWFYWEDGATKYPDAGEGKQHVYRFRKDGTRIPEDDEIAAEKRKKEKEEREVAQAHTRKEKLDRIVKKGPYLEKRELFVCDCGDISHQFVANLDILDEDWQHITIEVKLNRNLPWYKRFLVALSYLFGSKPCRFGDFDEIVLARKHAPQLQRVVDALIDLEDETEEEET